MSKIESRTGKIREKDTVIYNFLSDFNNYRQLMPPDRIKDWESTSDSCRFTIEGIGQAGLKIIDRQPHKLIKISSDEKTVLQFFMWIQLKGLDDQDTRIRITIDVDLNPVMLSMVESSLKEFIDLLVGQIEIFPFKNFT
jgi:hypothetical protein